MPLPRVAADPLAEHLRTYDRQPDDLIFTAPEGGPVQLDVWRQRFWARRCATPGWRTCAHTTCGTRRWRYGWPPAPIRRRWRRGAGHTSVSFTLDRYGHLLPGSEQRLNDALDALAEGAHPTAEVTRDGDETSNVREARLRSRT